MSRTRSTVGPLAALVLLAAPLFAQDYRFELRGLACPPQSEGLLFQSTRMFIDNNAPAVGSFSYGVCHTTTSDIAIASTNAGDDLLFANGGAPVDFQELNDFAGGWTASVIIDSQGQNTLAPGSSYELHRVTYALPEGGQVTLDFCDTLGSPPVPVAVNQQTGSIFTFESCLNCPDVNDLALTISDAVGAPGDEVTVQVRLANDSTFELFDFSYGIRHSPCFLEVVDAQTFDPNGQPGGNEVNCPTVTENGVTHFFSACIGGCFTTSVSTDSLLMEITYRLIGPPGTTTLVDFTSDVLGLFDAGGDCPCPKDPQTFTCPCDVPPDPACDPFVPVPVSVTPQSDCCPFAPRTIGAVIEIIGPPPPTDDVIVALEGESAVDSGSALQLALEANCRNVEVIALLNQALLGEPEFVWVLLGTYPNNHQLTDSEGQLLADLSQKGVSLYIESNDTWGFDPLTPLADFDGVAGRQTDSNRVEDGDDTFRGMVAEPHPGLDLSGMNAPYRQDQPDLNEFTDRLEPTGTSPFEADVPGTDAGIVWRDDGSGGDPSGYGTAIFYNADPEFGNVIAQSWEFGGYGGNKALLAEKYLEALRRCRPVTSLQCTAMASNVTLTWTNDDDYVALVVRRNSTVVFMTADPNTTGFTDSGVPPGSYTYEVQGACAGGNAAEGVACSVAVAAPCNPVTSLACNSMGNDVVLSWTNGQAYASIGIVRDSGAEIVLPGNATQFTDTGVAPGPHTYTVQGVCGAGSAAQRAGCRVTHGIVHFIRGDCDGNTMLNLADPVFLLGFAFIPGHPAPSCLEACDTDGNAMITGIVDGIFLLNCQFMPGNPPCPPPPFPECGLDPDPPSSLGCVSTACP